MSSEMLGDTRQQGVPFRVKLGGWGEGVYSWFDSAVTDAGANVTWHPSAVSKSSA